MTKELALFFSLLSGAIAIIFFSIAISTKNINASIFGWAMVFWQIIWAYKIKSSI